MGVFRHSAAALSAALGAPVAVGALALRPAWRSGFRQRLGAGPCTPGGIWLHAASVGEVRASARLVEELGRRGYPLSLSTTSVTGRTLAATLHPDTPCRLAPIDHPWCVDAALRAARPRALVLVETELWPTWIAACAKAEVPIVVVSGRISDRSFPRYRRLGAWLARTLRRLDAIGARTDIDAERFVALGAEASRVSVTGDLKLDPGDIPRDLDPALAQRLGKAPLIVAGSTHPGEEVALLDAVERLEATGLRAACVVAPRYPRRADEVVGLARRRGRRATRRSLDSDEPLVAGEWMVLDTLGELAAIYTRAEVAFVGGTLVPVGGHNLLEPVFAGRPVLHGPHVSNVAHIAEILAACGAATRVDDVDSLADGLAAVLRDPSAASARAERGRAELLRHSDSTERAVALVTDRIAPPAER